MGRFHSGRYERGLCVAGRERAAGRDVRSARALKARGAERDEGDDERREAQACVEHVGAD